MFELTQNKLLRVGIAFAICALILILLYLLPARYIFKYRNRLKVEFQSSQNKLQESQELIRNFANPQKAIEDIEKKAQELREMGATARQLPRIIQQLAAPASSLNINVISIRHREDLKIDEENLPAGVNKVNIELVMTCPNKVLAEYIKALSQLPVTFTIEHLSIEKKEEAPELSEANKSPDRSLEKRGELSANLIVSTYLIWEI